MRYQVIPCPTSTRRRGDNESHKADGAGKLTAPARQQGSYQLEGHPIQPGAHPQGRRRSPPREDVHVIAGAPWLLRRQAGCTRLQISHSCSMEAPSKAAHQKGHLRFIWSVAGIKVGMASVNAPKSWRPPRRRGQWSSGAPGLAGDAVDDPAARTAPPERQPELYWTLGGENAANAMVKGRTRHSLR